MELVLLHITGGALADQGLADQAAYVGGKTVGQHHVPKNIDHEAPFLPSREELSGGGSSGRSGGQSTGQGQGQVMPAMLNTLAAAISEALLIASCFTQSTVCHQSVAARRHLFTFLSACPVHVHKTSFILTSRTWS